MGNYELDKIVELFAKHIIGEVDLNGWLGNALEKQGFDLSEVSKEETHRVLISTILKLYEDFEEDIDELEEENEFDAEEEEEEEDYEEEDDE